MLSDFLPVTSGVIQGSVCGSQLFKLYINDLPEVIPPAVKVYLFADDTKLTKIIRTIVDCLVLQAALCSAASWSVLWQLTLNIIKSIVQHLGRSNPKYSYRLSGLTLESCDHVKDLGNHREQRLVVSQAYRKQRQRLQRDSILLSHDFDRRAFLCSDSF